MMNMVPQISAIMNSSIKSLGRWLSAEMMNMVPQNSSIENSPMKSLGRRPSAEMTNGNQFMIGKKNNRFWFIKSVPPWIAQ
jgi:hypothetical protein